MGTPAAVMGDRITGMCLTHLIPNPATGVPQPSPPLPFAAPLTDGTVATVLINGKPAAVAGASGTCVPPHVGLHPADPNLVPMTQKGIVVRGSATVLIGGRPAAMTGAQVTICKGAPGQLAGSAANVMVGG